MTITPAQLYWITRLDSIGVAFAGIIIISILVGIISVIAVSLIYTEEVRERLIVWAKVSIAIAITHIICGAFIPSTKEMCAILIVPAIANNEKVQGLGEDLYDLAKEWMQELKPAKGASK